MKIVHIITRLIVGGAQENTLLSCEGQHALGHDVTLITGPALGPEGSLMTRAESAGYRVVVIDAMRRAIRPTCDWSAYRQLTARLRELKPDVVHTHSSKAGILGRYAARAAGVPCVVHTIHGLAFTASTRALVNAAYKLLEKQAAPLTDRIVCVADSMAEQSLAAGIGQPEQYVTVYSGMPTAPFLNPPVPRDQTRAYLGLSDNHVVVGTIARLFELKGHDDLLGLAPGLCSAFPLLRFLWVGDGLLRPSFEARLRSMNLADRFIFTGLVSPDQVPELAAAMDIVAHPSRREGLARALPQGALAGCPCVTYDIDGAKEAVRDGVTGLVVRPFDIPAFGDALRTLLANRDRRATMGAAGRAMAVQRFDTTAMIAGLENVYRGCAQRSQAVRPKI